MKRLALLFALLALTTACTEEVGLIDEDSNFGGSRRWPQHGA